MLRRLGLGFSVPLLVLLAFGATASAQAIDDEVPPGATDDTEEAPPTQELGAPDEEPSEEPARDENDPRELENTDYFFIGAFYRHVMIPAFIQQVAVAGGIDGSNPGVGASFNWRRNNFNVVANFWWNNIEGQGWFRGLNDNVLDTEWIESRLGAIFLNAEFLWSFPITDWFAFELGFDIGFGFLYGNIVRTEAYPTGGTYAPCANPGQPDGAYCEGPRLPPETCFNSEGGHYQCAEPSWTTQGGDVPVIVPWISIPHIALRFKPVRQLQIRVDGGYGIYNFFFGLGASYGF